MRGAIDAVMRKLLWLLPVLLLPTAALANSAASPKIVRAYLKDGSLPIGGSIMTRGDGSRTFEVGRTWSNGKGATTAQLRQRERNGRTKLVTDVTTIATSKSLEVTTKYPKGSFLASSLKSDQMELVPTKGGFKTLDIRTLPNGDKHTMLRVVVNKGMVEYTQPELSSHRYRAERGRAFSMKKALPSYLQGDVKTMPPRFKIALVEHLRSEGMTAFMDFVNKR